MKIEFLYFEGCPNHGPALARLENILKQKGIADPVKTINVTSDEMSHRERFLGSPSIRINGKDIEEPLEEVNDDFGRKCRIYFVEGKPVGIPSEHLINRSIQRALLNEIGLSADGEVL